ncbi:flagellar biosynthetic protein FliO [Variovorax sp. E3]|uniref:flagellar biosynthetic protein FliO n=1 Tax=Variovorax sp. E3 TaxID=1914993 RepID=UPI0018DBB51C|nr:flagellar biosynthetic protein FliO [Variovorax sp. E3]
MNLRRHLLAKGAALPALLLSCTHAALAALPTVPTPVHEAPAPSAVGAGGLLQAGFGMALVVGLIFLCAWLARRFGLQRLGGGQHVKVVSSAMVGQRERVVVVEVADTWLVLGVTSSQVNMLHTLPAQAPHHADTHAAACAPNGARGPVELFARKLRESLSGKAQHPAP